MPTKTKPKLRFQWWKNPKTKEFSWHVRARNGEILCQGESYKRFRSISRVYVILFASLPPFLSEDSEIPCPN